MEDNREPATDDPELSEASPAANIPLAEKTKRGNGCVWFFFACAVCVLFMILGAVLFSYLWGKKISSDTHHTATSNAYFFDKEKICEMAFIQQRIMVDTTSRFPWSYNMPLNMGNLEIGSAEAKVRGIYLVKYGIDQAGINVWEYYPETRELQMSSPTFKVISVQTVFQELDSENESFLKKLQRSERNQAFKRNRNDAEGQADAAISTDKALQQQCTGQLRELLSSFGIKLVIIPPRPVLQ